MEAEVNVRVPAAMFFLVLLAIYGRDDPALIAWVLAFVPPWLALLGRTRSRSSG